MNGSGIIVYGSVHDMKMLRAGLQRGSGVIPEKLHSAITHKLHILIGGKVQKYKKLIVLVLTELCSGDDILPAGDYTALDLFRGVCRYAGDYQDGSSSYIIKCFYDVCMVFPPEKYECPEVVYCRDCKLGNSIF